MSTKNITQEILREIENKLYPYSSHQKPPKRRRKEDKMAEYIERKKAIDEFMYADADICQEYAHYDCEFGFSREAIKQVLMKIKTADVAPVIHGRWESCFEDWRQQIEGSKCSVCGYEHYAVSILNYNYCPGCGAKMDGGSTE